MDDGSEPIDDGVTVLENEVTLKCSYPTQTLADDIRIQYKQRDADDSTFVDATAVGKGSDRWFDETKYTVSRSVKDPFYTHLTIKSTWTKPPFA